MKRRNRILALLISLVLVLTLLPAAAFADADTDITNASVTNCTVSKVYTGKFIRQNPVLVLADRTLVAGEDYSVSYKNNKNVGTATVTITGKGAYTGSVKKTFKIIPKGSSITNTSRGYHYVKLTWSKRALKMSKSRITGYRIRYSKKRDMSNSKVKVFKGYTKTSAKITKLAAGTKYYFQVRTYKVKGNKTYYSKWSAPKQVTTKSYNTANKYLYGCVKAGNNVYCTANGNIYKVNVKTNKKTLLKKTNACEIGSLAIHNGYLYFIKDFYFNDVKYPLQLCKISLSTKKVSMVVPAIEYYFDGGRIYYASYKASTRYDDGYSYETYKAGNWMSMKFNGTDKKNTGRFGSKYSGKYKVCNVKNYSYRIKYFNDDLQAKVYLRKPNKKTIYLTTEWTLQGVPHEWLIEDGYY